MASRFYVRSPDFTRYTRGMKGFRNDWRKEVKTYLADLSDDAITYAREFKPDLAGRSGLLNQSWAYDKPTYRGGVYKTTIFNLAPYALTIEEGLINPKPVWVKGSFNPAFSTGHGLPMFFPGGANARWYFMPKKPWKGFFMLEQAIAQVEDEMPISFDIMVGHLSRLKGIN